MEKRLQYIAEDINALLDKTEIAVDTEADRELMTNTPIARAGGLGRVVYVKATKKSYQYNIDTGEWVTLPTSGVEIDAEISSTSENPVQNKVISGALDEKQDKLTAGENITIQNNVISARTSQPVYKHKLLINVTIGTYATTAIYNYLSNSSEAITDFTSVDDDFDIGASNASADNLVKVFGIRVTKVGNVVTVKGTDSTFAELTGSATLGNDSVSQL